MKKKLILITLLLLVPISIIAQDSTIKSPEQNDPLTGNWKIDLRPTPDSDGYYQSFNVKVVNGNTFSGSFYGSEIKNAMINRNWAKIYFAFSTSDQSNEYYHSGYLENGKLFGITYCPNREFTAPWTGVIE
jgi:hypothetical protein